ncbi:alanine dehydrogenase [Aeromonas cavernicola]|uniref:Alanine dehydrogenase n=1 Tax=Aeromonas cavernicola TaxID=1006623 RepID=A0A2H9U5F2_9GAMM|nr:alanine dehydrogenase [Aeromonas cavernicola]PJG59257.1 alanine dehydrogenase [Aeromonas cavernicola]
MIIGVPKEIKNHEYRVGMIPSSVRELTARNHTVFVQSGAGNGIGFADTDYLAVGAEILPTAAELFAKAEMIVKVKEPQPVECAMLRPGQTLFTYLHLAPDLSQTQALLHSGAICIAYETVTDKQGGLPLLAPMSEVAGRMSIQAGAMALEKSRGGSGILLGGVPGVEPAKVVIIGGGVVGSNAARMAIGLRADVTILDNNIDTLRRLDNEFQGSANLVYSNSENLARHLLTADLVIGGVLVPGATAPKLVTREHIARMKAGSAIVDVAIDQGGCVATSHPTTHQDPTFIVDGVVHYCVANMPGAVARTATVALNNATLPFIIKLAQQGYRQALLTDPHLLHGLNVMAGRLTCQEVATAHQLPYTDPLSLLN